MDANFYINMFWLAIFIGGLIALKQYSESPGSKGIIGENAVSRKLRKLKSEEYLVLHDILLPYKNRTTQIDHIVISVYGIFVIETKNMSGLIVGSEKSAKWSQILYKSKESMMNPINQNKLHINAISLILEKNISDKIIHNFVVFPNETTLKLEVETQVLKYDELIKTVRTYDKKVYNQKEISEIYQLINDSNIKGKEARAEHVEKLKTRIGDTKEKVEHNICPQCAGSLTVRKGKFGDFTGCENYPQCRFTTKGQ